MDYSIKWRNRVRRAYVADNHRYHFILQSPLPPQSVYPVIDNKVQIIELYNFMCTLPPDVLKHLCNKKLIMTCAKANPDAIAMGVDVDSMNMS